MPAPYSRSEEAERLASLRACEILDTEFDPNFDTIARIARRLLNVSTAAISFIAEHRQWFKSASGMLTTGGETSRDVAFCEHAIRSPTEVLVVEDASCDPRFAGNPLVVRPGGIRFYAGVPLLDDAGRALGTLCVIDEAPRRLSAPELDILRDLALAAAAALDLHRNLLAMRASERGRQEVTELNPQIPWTASPDGHILEVIPSLVITVAAGNAENLITPDWTRLIHPDDLPEARRLREHAISIGQPYDIEHRMRSANGTWRWFRSFAAPRRNEKGDIVLWYGSSEDITERKLSQQQVLHMAYHDGLTGLPNRIKFSDLLLERITLASSQSTSFALLCLDLDHFKGVNDRLGHPAGDSVLKQIAERLADCMQPTDVLARFGSDEFFMIQTCQADAVMLMAERVSAALSAPLAVQGHVFSVTASIGVAQYPQDGTDPDALFRNADLALYRAKSAGRATCCLFDESLDESQSRLLALRLDLQDAINRDEFELAYQPLVNLRTKRVDGFEALLRWRHPSRGLVPPAEFIPCAEESGLIIPIGEWVLDRACRQAATWPGDVSVAVNLSPVQFRSPNLLAAIAASLERSGLPAHRLELEITESVLLLNDDVNLSLLRALRDNGIRIALDDFGTGYSSMSYLQRFRFDKLKIDRSLISRVAEGEDERAVVRAVIAMCRALGIRITAEGVETQAQFDHLRVENCDQAQGYLISRPVPFAEVSPLTQRLNGMAEYQGSSQGLSRRRSNGSVGAEAV